MEDKEKLILDFLGEKEYVPMKAIEIAYMLNVPKNEYSKFMQVLTWLEKESQDIVLLIKNNTLQVFSKEMRRDLGLLR